LADEIIRQMLEKCLRDACSLAETACSRLSERRDLDHTYRATRALRREPSVRCKNIKSESGT